MRGVTVLVELCVPAAEALCPVEGVAAVAVAAVEVASAGVGAGVEVVAAVVAAGAGVAAALPWLTTMALATVLLIAAVD